VRLTSSLNDLHPRAAIASLQTPDPDLRSERRHDDAAMVNGPEVPISETLLRGHSCTTVADSCVDTFSVSFGRT
jgi:hypothetical protein